MGTLKTAIDRARVKIRDTSKLVFTSDAEIVGIVNTILDGIYQDLCNVSSNLVYAVGTVTTVADTIEYTPSFSHNGFLRDGSWVDGEEAYLAKVSEADKIKWDYTSSTNQPEAFYVTEDNKIGYLWVPDNAYTIYHTYWKPLTELTSYDNDDIPWYGIWDKSIEKLLVVDLLEIMERDNSRAAIQAEIAWNSSMNQTYKRGTRQERQVSDMFMVGGI